MKNSWTNFAQSFCKLASSNAGFLLDNRFLGPAQGAFENRQAGHWPFYSIANYVSDE
jgi:hypothetical protein